MKTFERNACALERRVGKWSLLKCGAFFESLEKLFATLKHFPTDVVLGARSFVLYWSLACAAIKNNK